MKISTLIWDTLIDTGRFAVPVFIIAMLVILELHFIKIKCRGKIILPVAVLIFSLLISLFQFRFVSFEPSESLRTQVEYTSELGVKHHFTILHTEEEHILAIGQLISEENENSKFINLSVKNGKIVSTSEPVDFVEDIELYLSNVEGGYSGKSVPYGELAAIEAQYKKQQSRQVDLDTFLYGICYRFIAVGILFALYGVGRKREGGVAR